MANIVFFVLTSVHCNKVKAEIKRMTTDPADPRSKRFHSDRIRWVVSFLSPTQQDQLLSSLSGDCKGKEILGR
jgi:hypothetical protein